MRQNRKGFTLIELLAVIVILAIIALIATPIVLNMINSARKSAAKSSSLGFIDSVEYYSGFAQANSDGMDLDGYNSSLLPTNGVVCSKADKNSSWTTTSTYSGYTFDDTACDNLMKAVEAKSKGKAPDAASISIDAAGKVRSTTWLKYGDFVCEYNGSDISGDCTKPSSNPANGTAFNS